MDNKLNKKFINKQRFFRYSLQANVVNLMLPWSRIDVTASHQGHINIEAAAFSAGKSKIIYLQK